MLAEAQPVLNDLLATGKGDLGHCGLLCNVMDNETWVLGTGFLHMIFSHKVTHEKGLTHEALTPPPICIRDVCRIY